VTYACSVDGEVDDSTKMVVFSALMRRGPSVLSAAALSAHARLEAFQKSHIMPPIGLNEASVFALILTNVLCAENDVSIPQASGLDSAQDFPGPIISAVTTFHHR
jgi:hypothetical protein